MNGWKEFGNILRINYSNIFFFLLSVKMTNWAPLFCKLKHIPSSSMQSSTTTTLLQNTHTHTPILNLFKIFSQHSLNSHTQIIPRHQISSSPSGRTSWYQHSTNLNTWSHMASSLLSQTATFTTAIIKVHSPHSFPGFFLWPKQAHCSGGTFAFPFSYPQADT